LKINIRNAQLSNIFLHGAMTSQMAHTRENKKAVYFKYLFLM